MIDMFFLKFQSDHISSLIKCFRGSLRAIKYLQGQSVRSLERQLHPQKMVPSDLPTSLHAISLRNSFA